MAVEVVVVVLLRIDVVVPAVILETQLSPRISVQMPNSAQTPPIAQQLTKYQPHQSRHLRPISFLITMSKRAILIMVSFTQLLNSLYHRRHPCQENLVIPQPSLNSLKA